MSIQPSCAPTDTHSEQRHQEISVNVCIFAHSHASNIIIIKGRCASQVTTDERQRQTRQKDGANVS